MKTKRFTKHAAFAARSKNVFIHSAFAHTLGLIMFLASTMLAALPEVSQAQPPCPAGYAYATTQEIIPGTTCVVTLGYCWENVGGVLYVIFDYVYASGSPPCTGIAPQDIVLGAVQAFEANPQLPAGSGVNLQPCGQGETTELHYNMGQCWQLSAYGFPVECAPLGTIGNLCNNGEGGCETVCEYCWDAASQTIVEISCTNTSTYTGDCALVPSGGPLPCVCYNIEPCPQ